MNRYVIAGAGLSGLCLANALRRAGAKVLVYERDPGPAARGQGYRLTVDPDGDAALRACLRREAYERIVDSSSRTGDGFCFVDQAGRELLRLTFRQSGQSSLAYAQVDRQDLRDALLEDVREDVLFGEHVVDFAFERGRPVVVLQDGRRTTADFCVLADGARSKLARKLVPASAPRLTGLQAIFGKAPYNGETKGWFGGELERGGLMALGENGTLFFSTAMEKRRYLMWAVALRSSSLHGQSHEHDLLRVAHSVLAGFSADFHRVLECSSASDTLVVPICAAPRLRPWQPRPITVVGDAIHAMPPFGAHGANTALTDAAVLFSELSTNAGDALRAVARYESAMRRYANRTVRRASLMMHALASQSPIVRASVRAAMRTVSGMSQWLDHGRHALSRHV